MPSLNPREASGVVSKLRDQAVIESIWYGEDRFGLIVYGFVETDATSSRKVFCEDYGIHMELVYTTSDSYEDDSLSSIKRFEPDVVDEAELIATTAYLKSAG